MEHISYIAWMILFPIMWSLTCLMDAKTKAIRGIENSDKDETSDGRIILFIIYMILWFGIGNTLR